MKKIIAAICLLLVVSMLCACNSSSNATTAKDTTSSEERYYTIEDQTPIPVNDDITVVDEPVTKAGVEELTEPVQRTELSLGEPVEVDNLRFTLSGISGFVEQYSPDNKNFYDVANAETYSFILIYFTVLNTGGDKISPSILNMSVISNGDRVHESHRVWYFDADCINTDTLEVGSWVATSPKLEVADGEREGINVFQLPDSILDSEESLDLIVKIKDTEYVYHIR